MYKKSILLVAMMLLLIGVGCGKEEAKETIEALEVQEKGQSDIPEKKVEDLDISEREEIIEIIQEEVVVEKKSYEKSTDWDTLGLKERAVQIGDLVYVPGISVAEFIERVGESEIDYIYEYNANKLTSHANWEKISFSFDGTEWFRIDAVNVFGETRPLSDLIILDIYIFEEAEDNMRYLDGRTYEDILLLNYNDVLGLEEGLLSGYYTKVSESNTTIEDQECIRVEYEINDTVLAGTAEKYGYEVTFRKWLYFYISKEEGVVIRYREGGALGYGSKKSD